MTEQIKIGHVRRHNEVAGLNPVFLEELDCLTLHGQSCNDYGVYRPEVTVVIYNTGALYIGIHVALGEDECYYTHYDVESPTGGSGGWPSKRGRKAKTINQALRVEINKLKEYRLYQDDTPDKRICQIAEESLAKINTQCVSQMTIFDVLGDETI